MGVIKDIYSNKISKIINPTQEQKYIHLDNSIEIGFHIYRHWFQFTVPKAFRVIDSLLRYVCTQNGKKSGSYSYFVQQLENDFILLFSSSQISLHLFSREIHAFIFFLCFFPCLFLLRP